MIEPVLATAPDLGVQDAASAWGGPPVDAAGTWGAPTDMQTITQQPGTATELETCASDGDCVSGLVCRALLKSDANRCTRPCTADANCMQGTHCIDFATEHYCALTDVGRPCTDGSSCNAACIVTPGYCTVPCASGADCPNGYGCMPVGAQQERVCVIAELACENSTSGCIASSACDASLMISGCTTTCNAASDCPQRAAGLAAWTCDSGICHRPADVVGPLGQQAIAQYACSGSTVVNLCDDAQHIDFDTFSVPAAPAITCPVSTSVSGAAGDACVDSCTYQGACAFGSFCSAVGSLGNSRIGLCLPGLGASELGAACTTDSGCAFGYCNRATNKCTRDCTVDGVCGNGTTCTTVSGPLVNGVPFRRCQ